MKSSSGREKRVSIPVNINVHGSELFFNFECGCKIGTIILNPDFQIGTGSSGGQIKGIPKDYVQGHIISHAMSFVNGNCNIGLITKSQNGRHSTIEDIVRQVQTIVYAYSHQKDIKGYATKLPVILYRVIFDGKYRSEKDIGLNDPKKPNSCTIIAECRFLIANKVGFGEFRIDKSYENKSFHIVLAEIKKSEENILNEEPDLRFKSFECMLRSNFVGDSVLFLKLWESQEIINS